MADERLYSPVRRQERLSVQVADQIQDLVTSGHFKIGDRLPAERDLCERFDVSRTVVREAIRALEAKGLVVSQGGSGTYVKGIGTDDIADSIGIYISTRSQPISHAKLMEVRRVLEVQIAAMAAGRATEASLADLDELLTRMETDRDHPSAFAKHDLQFHVALARTTGNELFVVLLDPFMDALYEARRLMMVKVSGVADEAIELHRSVLERVRAGDADGAAAAMSLHLDQSARVMRQALEDGAG